MTELHSSAAYYHTCRVKICPAYIIDYGIYVYIMMVHNWQCYIQKAGRSCSSKRWSISLGMKQKAERIITISWMPGKQAHWPNNVCSMKFMTNNYAFYIIHCSYIDVYLA